MRRLLWRDAQHRQQEHQRRDNYEPAANPEQAASKTGRSARDQQGR
jgi:hypothetical protein